MFVLQLQFGSGCRHWRHCIGIILWPYIAQPTGDRVKVRVAVE
jgi:hypothetical protein